MERESESQKKLADVDPSQGNVGNIFLMNCKEYKLYCKYYYYLITLQNYNRFRRPPNKKSGVVRNWGFIVRNEKRRKNARSYYVEKHNCQESH